MDEKSRFEKSITVVESDLDQLNHVNNITYIEWIQDIAKEHWFSRAPKELNDKYFWVVISHDVKYKRSCFLNEKLSIKTEVGEIDGAKWPRKVQIFKEDGSLAVDAVTGWCLMDKIKGRPVRVSEDISRVFLDK
jgi:acyl-CoA thioester hydrolase